MEYHIRVSGGGVVVVVVLLLLVLLVLLLLPSSRVLFMGAGKAAATAPKSSQVSFLVKSRPLIF